MVAYYQHDIARWMDGTEGLDDGEYRVYHVVVELIYLHDGPIVEHEQGLAGRCNQHVLAFRRNLQKLVDRRKLFRTAEGKLSNKKAETELVRIAERRRKPPPDPPRTPAAPPADPPPTPAEPPRGRAAKPLKNKGRGRVDSKERRREERRKKDPPPSGEARAARLPYDWKPSPADLGFAEGRGLSGTERADEVAKFANHWHALAGARATSPDWPAKWRNWVLGWQERQQRRKPNETDRRGGQLDLGVVAERVRRERDARRAAARGVPPGDGPGDPGAPVVGVGAERR